MNRECDGLVGVELRSCALAVEAVASAYATQTTIDARLTLSTLRTLLISLRDIAAPKTMILVSEGFVLGDELASLVDLGSLAAAARTSIYTLKLEQVPDASFANSPSTMRIDDRLVTSQGLEVLANVSRGSVFQVSASADIPLERIESEISGYYLLGIESEPNDKDGRPHEIRVDVSRPGATVRSRRALQTIETVTTQPAPGRDGCPELALAHVGAPPSRGRVLPAGTGDLEGAAAHSW